MAVTARPSRPVSVKVALDISSTLDRLRYARQLDPDHNEKFCPDCCEVCILTRRLDWLLDTKIPRHRKATR